MNTNATIYTFLTIGIVVTLALVVAPAVYAVSLSFYHMESFVGARALGWTRQLRARARGSRVLERAVEWRDLSIGTIVLQVVLGIGLALILNQYFPGRALVRGLSILPYLLPTVVVVLTFKWMVDGSIGSLRREIAALGLPPVSWFESPFAAMASVIMVSVWMWTPFVTTCFLAGLQTIPGSLYEAAKVDGTTAVQRFFHITLPMLKPVLTVIVLLRVI